ncbi:MAG: hypothetical protein M4579_004199 [Chaenotheca gracillima]|nr:MAG: hypothetical protein M4579_004199 [Chaenotheca gracillima]
MNSTQPPEQPSTERLNPTNVDDAASAAPVFDSPVLMGDPVDAAGILERPSLDAHRDARAIVRLVQCSQCSKPLQLPITLPCGNSLCRTCLPPLRQRENITYPDTPARQQGFVCPFSGCQQEHPIADCCLDVTLTKVMDVVATEIARHRVLTSNFPLLLEASTPAPSKQEDNDMVVEEKLPSRVLHGGRLVATYTMVEMGEVAFDAEVAYHPVESGRDNFRYLDVAALEHLKESTRSELDCLVCYALMLDPVTTACGHTFCRKCLYRVLDHSNLCPVCRRKLALLPSTVRAPPSNSRLMNILAGLCPDLLAARVAAVAADESGELSGLNTPIFVCTLSYPSMPTFLHIFEPRYRLMIRRTIESGTRKFGMVIYNQTSEPQGELGRCEFMQYGTLLHVKEFEMMPDGRMIIETVGVSRFKVRNWGIKDDYKVADIERIDDVSLAEEERIEAAETSSPAVASHDLLGQLDRLSTQELLEIGINFIIEMQGRSASWLHERVLAAYGGPPDDPALFPYWFASILPISDLEKYKLLPTTSVRERLKITARWVRRLQAQRW